MCENRIKGMVANKPDWAELPRTVRREVEFVWVETMDQVVSWTLLPPSSPGPAVPVSPLDEGEVEPAAIVDGTVNENGSVHETPAVQTASRNGKRSPRNGHATPPDSKKNRAAKPEVKNQGSGIGNYSPDTLPTTDA